MGKRVVRNYNTLLGRYPGADGMKTGFICASGFNLVATATRDGRRLIAVVLGAPSSGVRAVKAAHLLEQGFTAAPLSWLTPSLGSVESLTPINADPVNLHEEMCGAHRKRPAAEEEEDAGISNAPADSPYAVFLSSLRPQAKGSLLQTESNLGEPVVVFTGSPRGQGQAVTQVASTDAKPVKPPIKNAVPKPNPAVAVAAPVAGPGVATASTVPWSSLSPAALAANPPTELAAPPVRASALVPLPRARPRVPVEKPDKSQIK
jgi:D-alanyl-D-alanine carboxypeptidase